MHSNKLLNSSIWPIDGTQKGTTYSGQIGPGVKGNEEVVHIPQSSWTKATPSEAV